jgi:hypothetical protein
VQNDENDARSAGSAQGAMGADCPKDWRIVTGLPGDGVCFVDRAGCVVPYRLVQSHMMRLLEFYRRVSDVEIDSENRSSGPVYAASAPAHKLATRYLDVQPFCKPRLLLSAQARYSTVELREGETGFVYLMGWVGLPYYKIGHTREPYSRVREIAKLHPAKLEIVHLIPADRPRPAEKHLHAIFSDRLVNGEYFILSDEDIKWLLSLECLRHPYPSLER